MLILVAITVVVLALGAIAFSRSQAHDTRAQYLPADARVIGGAIYLGGISAWLPEGSPIELVLSTDALWLATFGGTTPPLAVELRSIEDIGIVERRAVEADQRYVLVLRLPGAQGIARRLELGVAYVEHANRLRATILAAIEARAHRAVSGCERCGEQLPPASNFCPACGARVHAVTPSNAPR